MQAFPGTSLYKSTEPPPPGTSATQGPLIQELLFDQNPELFSYVLGYYCTQQLCCPANICQSIPEEDLAYWGLEEAPLAACCWLKLSGKDSQTQDFLPWEACENVHKDKPLQQNPTAGRLWNVWKPWLWVLPDQPPSSLEAKVTQCVVPY